ncbi:lipopolysaccharide biosynthesis protein [Burkholderia stagnalis]|uniref:Polysaccharide biosynthesis protein n=1 Tax=Burkholderia stagnalis TaxID=1503054 RepID=A0ABX9YD42_9BURK|nr:polysaccharide biosynthesis protein [Burkholderia stagnalis]RQQ47553.1 polysaccharide biosynthesis protein [Burkholderia stagnalis]RQQ59048.1 polysaccharide biosynthesis protein [Burkholderia stagnalis]RQQ59577.1 polysaccharide biosynthesis protein [Burkholderia stagnalis]RQQ73882.1 polysaccharide biosynthesis protein [Burkholderia stagnalis]RQQ79668.1 polysaccharide biosynthesis protein [Burkholderia stagnalis]
MLMRLTLRIASLCAKFTLTIAIARLLGFAAVADYGLAIAISVIVSKVLGLGFSSELNRRLALPAPRLAIQDARMIGLIYAFAYLLLGSGAMLLLQDGLISSRASTTTPWLAIVAVAIAEHYAFECNTYIFSLHRVRSASLMLFARTGAWPAIAIAGLMFGVITRFDDVLLLWIAVNGVVIVWAWRVIVAAGTVTEPLPRRTSGYHDILCLWRDGLPFYFGAALLACLQYAERLIAAPIVSDDALGRYVFAWSIANAIQTIAFAAIASTAAPALARAAAAMPHTFAPMLRRALLASLVTTLLLSGAILTVREPLFRLAHEPLDATGTMLLAILLLSFVLRGAVDLLWSAAIALKLGRAFVLASALLATCSLPITWYAIHTHGVLGAAYSHLFVSALLTAGFGWLLMRVYPRSRPVCMSLGEKANRHAL